MTGGMAEGVGIVSLVTDRLLLLGGSVPLDKRMSWYDEAPETFVPFNSYLLQEDDHLLLVEAGVPAMFDDLEPQLRAVCRERPPPTRLAVTRNEPDCVANIPLLVRKLGLETVHSPGLMNTLQFFAAGDGDLEEQSFVHRATELQMMDFGVQCRPATPQSEVPVGAARRLSVIAAPLRVLPTVWYHDSSTRTLFCSDSFADEVAVSPDHRLLTTVDSMEVLIDRFHRSFPLKFDWLERSDLSTVIADLATIFDTLEIERLAPNRGVVIEGHAAVRAKQAALIASLRALA